ncbi:MAG: hypothetical protein NUV31_04895 [Dehalococcoidales bacterium]|nr:hypothetical protein [Dehalococcoidales bacterium]
MKQLWLIGCLIILILVAVSCGGNKETVSTATPARTTASAPATTTPIKTTVSSPSSTGTPTTTTPVSSTPKTGQDVLSTQASLPADYPKDIFPVYPGSKVVQALKVETGFAVVAYSDAGPAKVIAYYRDVLKDATVTNETVEETHFESFGTKKGYTYTLAVADTNEFKGYNTAIWLNFYK